LNNRQLTSSLVNKIITLFNHKNTRLIFAKNLRTIPALAKDQSLKFSI